MLCSVLVIKELEDRFHGVLVGAYFDSKISYSQLSNLGLFGVKLLLVEIDVRYG
jgi:hypothetical protein